MFQSIISIGALALVLHAYNILILLWEALGLSFCRISQVWGHWYPSRIP